MHLESRKKYSTSSGASTRMRPATDTLSDIIPICRKIGVTRMSDITFMDRLYIPNCSAMLPGTHDLIWVYGGKGITKSDARAGALMEAIERYSSLDSSYPRNFVRGSYTELSKSYNKVLHPAEVVEPITPEYDEKDTLDFLPGFDLLNNETVLIPAEIALYKYVSKFPAKQAFSVSHTNGLASGNVMEEAICHSLCEIIERDAVSIADLCASCIPYNILEKIIDSLQEGRTECSFARIRLDKFVDDWTIFQDVDISEIAEEFKPIRYLVNRFADANVPLLVKDITQKDIGIPTFVASSIEWITHDYGYFAKGFGAHPDARVALVRAITEVSQTRAANVQGAREDLKRIQYKEGDEIYKRKWQFMPCSTAKRSDMKKGTLGFSDITSYVNQDVLDDIDLILENLHRAGLTRVIVVDLTHPEINIPVVRTIVPGLETFEVTQSVMSDRAKGYFKGVYSL